MKTLFLKFQLLLIGILRQKSLLNFNVYLLEVMMFIFIGIKFLYYLQKKILNENKNVNVKKTFFSLFTLFL